MGNKSSNGNYAVPAWEKGLAALISPYIQFSLRNLEHFLHCEKTLALRRGLVPSAVVRDPTVALSPAELSGLDFIIAEMMLQLKSEGFDPSPNNRHLYLDLRLASLANLA